MANIQVFEYQNNKVRTVDVGGEAWFVLKDVCEILRMDTTQLKKVADRLDEDEKGRTLITTPGGMQETWIVNESGLYHVILRSDKPNGQRTLLPDEDDQQPAWSVRLRERKVRLVAAVGRLLFRLANCMEAGQHRKEDKEVRA